MPDAFTPGLLQRLPEPPRKVAIVCASRIGDFLCATPGFRALRASLPGAEITLIGLPFVRELAERNCSLDRHVEFPGFPGIAEQFFDARRAAGFFRAMQDERFDLAVQMHGSGVYSNPFTLLLGAQYTAGCVREEDGPGRLDAALRWPEHERAARRALLLAAFLGAEPRGEHTDFPLSIADRRAAEALLAGCAPPFIGLHPGAREAGKVWPARCFAEAGIKLRRKTGGTLVIIGGPEEKAAGDRIAAEAGPPVLNLAGPRSLGEMGAVIARLDLLITNDSGPAHIAYALNTSSVTLFGETDPTIWGPPLRPEHHIIAAAGGRIDSIGVEEVVRAALGE